MTRQKSSKRRDVTTKAKAALPEIDQCGPAPQVPSDDARRRSSVEPKPDKSKSQHSPVPAKSKKKQAEKWTGRDAKQNFAHEWLLTNLKGHTGAILDMDFSANGKFLATCADDDPGGTSGNSSGSEGNKENSSPRGGNTTLSRRQKKNRGRNSSPPTTTTSKKKQKKHCHTVLRQYAKLNLSDYDLFETILNYTLRPEDLFLLGYPVESRLYPGRAMIFRNQTKPFDVNAKEFVPKDESVYASLLVQNGSEQFGKAQEIVPVKRPEPECTTEEKKCVRCQKSFFITSTGEYLTQEHCMYHWGKLLRPPSGGSESFYSCCKAKKYTKGCSTAKLHVWSGVDPGRNGPFDGYVRTRPRKTPPPDGNYGVYALDCEMCYTTSGLELTKISVVAHDGRLVYDTYVRPESLIIDYNTRFSGVTAKDLSKRTKLLKDVQNDLMGFITADTILIGHGLENDLRALRMVHTTVVDTAIIFPHILGPPYRRSLKSLVYQLLKRDIQRDSGGHNSYEDACSCLELVLWKIRKDRQFRDELLLGKC
uniref:RNA exonuclease 1 n=1 Tax=Lygus hesperus TaxID=30085 RepID=A0A146KNX1_LYGHE